MEQMGADAPAAHRQSVGRRQTMMRSLRVLLITLALSAVGAVLGAIAGAVALVAGLTITEGPSVVGNVAAVFRLLKYPALVGAVLGATGLPGVTWVLLRYLPLGRAFIGSVLGTIIGGTLFWALPPWATQSLAAAPVSRFPSWYSTPRIPQRCRHGREEDRHLPAS